MIAGVLVCASSAFADTTPGSLWIGNDGNSGDGILNTNTSGTVLRTIANTSAIGFAIDGNSLYVNNVGGGGGIYDLNTLATTGSFTLPHASEDMTFDGGFIWSGDFSGNALDKVDPATGLRVGGFSVGFTPLGLGTDGAGGFWVSEFASGAILRHFDGAGNLIGTMDPTDITSYRGGIAYDSSDGTLWIGTFGHVYHYTTAGVDLGNFGIADGRFVDGLEMSPSSVPEPGYGALLSVGMLLLAGLKHRLHRAQ
jgi:streptogramin lyase